VIRLPRLPLPVAIAAAIGARMLLFFVAIERRGREIFLVSDSLAYLGLARNIAAGSGFVDPYGDPEIFRAPGYPLLLAPGILAHLPIVYALALNVLCAVAIVIATHRLARRLFGDERLAGVCALVVAIEPTMLAWSLKVMPETLLTLLILVFVACAFRALESHGLRWTCAAALAACGAAYVKPIAYPLVAIVFLASLLLRVPRRSLAFLSLSIVLLAPWQLRNYARTGYAGFSTLVDRALYLSAGGSVIARREHRSYAEVRQQMLDRARIRARLDDPQRYARIRREGAALVASDPFGYALTHAKGTLRTMFDPGATEYLRFFNLYAQGAKSAAASGGAAGVARAYPLVLAASIALGIVLLPLVVLPLVALRHAPPRAFFVLAIVAAYLLLAGGGVPGYARFRVPAVPLLVLMCGFAFAQRRPRRCEREGGNALPSRNAHD
jgi:4-amino-4-deoxy-L-arabinose transferase-like glycosyltransferase